MTKLQCAACKGTKFMRDSPWHGAICAPCIMVWYDPDEDIDVTKPEEVGKLSLRLKAEGKWPWVGRYA